MDEAPLGQMEALDATGLLLLTDYSPAALQTLLSKRSRVSSAACESHCSGHCSMHTGQALITER